MKMINCMNYCCVKFGMGNSLATPIDQSTPGVPDNAAKLPFPVPGRTGGLDLTTTGNNGPLGKIRTNRHKIVVCVCEGLPSEMNDRLHVRIKYSLL